MPQRVRAWAVALGIAAMLSGVVATSAAAAPADFWGIDPQAPPTLEQLQRLRMGGVESIRIPIDWAGVQPTAGGTFDWAGVDALIGDAASAGIDVLPFVYGAPPWAVALDKRWSSPVTLPVRTAAQRSAWASFLTQAVARYGPNGSFWAENPAVPLRPIRIWQIWNEENFKYFVARPNPTDYGKLLKLSNAAIKAVDPAAQIVLGGMFARPKEAEWKRKPPIAYFAADFLRLMYKRTPGVKSTFEGVALHPYTRTYKFLGPEIEEVRQVMMANHDAGKGMWITEMGWSSQTPTASNVFAKGPAGQVAQLKGAFKLLSAKRGMWRIQRVYWFSVDDQAGSCNFCDGSGLFGPGFTPKPAWYAYVHFTGGTP